MEGWICFGLDLLNWGYGYGNNWLVWVLIQIGFEEMLVYWVEYWEYLGRFMQFRWGILWLDGFVSMYVVYVGGEFIIKLFVFEGWELVMNFFILVVGSVQVEIWDAVGNFILGFALVDCFVIYGDVIEQMVKWQVGSDVSVFVGQVVCLRFVMKDVDLYVICFFLLLFCTNGAVLLQLG